MSTGKMGHGLQEYTYIQSENHKLLAEDAPNHEGPNIGINGENLTISFLSMNRSSLSIRLCSSIEKHIPNFKGEVLVIDNGSSNGEIMALESFLATMPYRWRIVKLDKNYGVAGGRNRTIREVNTTWVMTLDNDIYLIKNPLPSIQRDISFLGCHFLSPVILDSDEETIWFNGGNIYLEHINGDLAIGGGSCYLKGYPNEQKPPFLCTFMPGGCGIFRCDTFNDLGGYDEGMFVGFEDVEFSLRIFRAGLKVGASNVAAFVHDHPVPSSNDDKDYERARFSRLRLMQAATHFEAKHGFKVWTVGVDGWVEQRERELEIAESNCTDVTDICASQSITSKKKIVLMVDIVDWALDNVALQLKEHLADEFDIEILPTNDMAHPSIGLSMAKGADLVHFLWRGPLFNMLLESENELITKLFGGMAYFWETVGKLSFSFTIFDHLFLDDDDRQRYQACFLSDKIKGYTVSSRQLFDIYTELSGFPPVNAVTQDGVDLRMFKPKGLGRLKEVGKSRPLRVGWVGNSTFGHWKGANAVKEDLKGFHSVIRPALDRLREAGHEIEERFADRQVDFIPHTQMPGYYAGIDVLLCASLTEGTPNPVLEAMACGIPVISTGVGIVPEVFGPRQLEFMMQQRSIESMMQLLLRLSFSPELLIQLSEENLHQIRMWDWAIRAESYRNFFREMIDSPKAVYCSTFASAESEAPR